MRDLARTVDTMLATGDVSALTGLAEAAGTGPAEPGSRPDIALLARATGVNVLRLSFRAGQVMADHRAARPILVLGQTGEVDFAVGGDTVALRPGVGAFASELWSRRRGLALADTTADQWVCTRFSCFPRPSAQAPVALWWG